MRTLLVDNHDSYTYNVFHLLAAASGEEPVVVNNDAVSWRVLSRSKFDAFVLSPGPGRPERWHDFGVCRDILRYSEIPVLGICLGHQGIGNLLEGGVTSAPKPMHGRLSHVRHDGTGIFDGVPQDFSVVRYHSLAITGPVGPEGHVVAWADDGVVMGVEHDPADVGRPVPPRVDRHRVRRRDRRELLRDLRSRHPPPRPRADPRPAVDGPMIAVDGRARKSARRPRGGPGGRAGACWIADARGGGADRAPLRTALRRRRARPSGSTPPTRRPGSPSAPTWGRAPAAERRLSYDVDAARRHDPHARRRRGGRHGSIFDLLDREIARRCERAADRRRPRPDRRLRRLPRLRAEGRLRLPQRPQLRPPRRGDDARQPRRRRRPRRRTHPRLRPRPRRATPRPERWLGRRPSEMRRAAAIAEPPPRRGRRRRRSTPRAAHVSFRVRPRPDPVPRRHRTLAGRTGGRRVLRGLPHRPDLDRREPRPVRALPPAAPLQPVALRRLPALRRHRDRQLLAGALPLGRPRRRGPGAADQGDDLARRGPGRGRRPPRRARRATRRPAPST